MNLFTLVFFTLAMRVTILTSDSVNHNCFEGGWQRTAGQSDRDGEKEKMKKGRKRDKKADGKNW